MPFNMSPISFHAHTKNDSPVHSVDHMSKHFRLLRKALNSSIILWRSTLMFSGRVVNTLFLRYPNRKKSDGVKFGKRGGHAFHIYTFCIGYFQATRGYVITYLFFTLARLINEDNRNKFVITGI